MKKYFLPIGVAVIVLLFHFILVSLFHFDPLELLSDRFGILGSFLWFLGISVFAILLSKWIRKSKKI